MIKRNVLFPTGSSLNSMEEILAKKEVDELSDCPHCDGKGVFVRCAGTVDELYQRCICKMFSDEE